MDFLEKIRRFESIHVVFWLIKDSCWMLGLKWLGAIMVVPTILLAMYLVFQTLRTRDFYINAAIFFWITANSFWMLMELFFQSRYKDFSIIPFVLGFIFIGLFYLKSRGKKENNN